MTLDLTLPSRGPRPRAVILGGCAQTTLLVIKGSLNAWPGQCKAISTPWDFVHTAPLRGGGIQEIGVRGLGAQLFLRK